MTRSHIQMKNGAVAIVDALGTASQHPSQIQNFINGRDASLQLFNGKCEGVQLQGQVETFTFGDTILFVLSEDERTPILDDVVQFSKALRKFLIDSTHRGLFFRGSLAIGEHYSHVETNTVLGPAVNDAAAWFEQAEWVGIHATPKTSLILRASPSVLSNNVFIEYNVPLKGAPIPLVAINWPKGLHLAGVRPSEAADDPRSYLLERLTVGDIPRGTESKYINTMSFYDMVVSNSTPKIKSRK